MGMHFRNWKATMLYLQSRDPYYLKRFPGHKSLKSAEFYIPIERTIIRGV